MAGINKVILVGNLGKDPEVRTIDNGAKVATFSLATTESYKGKDGNKVDQTEWHNIVLWRGLAELSEKYLKKGNQIYLEGRIKSRSYDDKDGIKRYITEIVGDNMVFLGKPNETSQEKGHYQTPPPSEEPAANLNDDGGDLPF